MKIFLLVNNFLIKISDFSLFKKIQKNNNIKLTDSTWNIKGPEYYTKDKIIKHENGIKVDIFGFGLIIY